MYSNVTIESRTIGLHCTSLVPNLSTSCHKLHVIEEHLGARERGWGASLNIL